MVPVFWGIWVVPRWTLFATAALWSWFQFFGEDLGEPSAPGPLSGCGSVLFEDLGESSASRPLFGAGPGLFQDLDGPSLQRPLFAGGSGFLRIWMSPLCLCALSARACHAGVTLWCPRQRLRRQDRVENDGYPWHRRRQIEDGCV